MKGKGCPNLDRVVLGFNPARAVTRLADTCAISGLNGMRWGACSFELRQKWGRLRVPHDAGFGVGRCA